MGIVKSAVIRLFGIFNYFGSVFAHIKYYSLSDKQICYPSDKPLGGVCYPSDKPLGEVLGEVCYPSDKSSDTALFVVNEQLSQNCFNDQLSQKCYSESNFTNLDMFIFIICVASSIHYFISKIRNINPINANTNMINEEEKEKPLSDISDIKGIDTSEECKPCKG